MTDYVHQSVWVCQFFGQTLSCTMCPLVKYERRDAAVGYRLVFLLSMPVCAGPRERWSFFKAVRCSCRMLVIPRQFLARDVEDVGDRRRSRETISQTSRQNDLVLSPAARRSHDTKHGSLCSVMMVKTRCKSIDNVHALWLLGSTH